MNYRLILALSRCGQASLVAFQPPPSLLANPTLTLFLQTALVHHTSYEPQLCHRPFVFQSLACNHNPNNQCNAVSNHQLEQHAMYYSSEEIINKCGAIMSRPPTLRWQITSIQEIPVDLFPPLVLHLFCHTLRFLASEAFTPERNAVLIRFSCCFELARWTVHSCILRPVIENFFPRMARLIHEHTRLPNHWREGTTPFHLQLHYALIVRWHHVSAPLRAIQVCALPPFFLESVPSKLCALRQRATLYLVFRCAPPMPCPRKACS